ncbi:MAG: CbbQ/NirQ/NorQ C-terminal domain-containing protein, partial [Planctomyces sp.]
PPAPREQQLLMVRTGVQPKMAEVLVKLANDQRSMAAEGTFLSPLSTRTLLAAAFQIARGIPIREAVQACMSARFSSEGGTASERSQFHVLTQKYLGPG